LRSGLMRDLTVLTPKDSLSCRAAEPGTGRAFRGAYVFAPNVAPSVIAHRWPNLVNPGLVLTSPRL